MPDGAGSTPASAPHGTAAPWEPTSLRLDRPRPLAPGFVRAVARRRLEGAAGASLAAGGATDSDAAIRRAGGALALAAAALARATGSTRLCVGLAAGMRAEAAPQGRSDAREPRAVECDLGGDPTLAEVAARLARAGDSGHRAVEAGDAAPEGAGDSRPVRVLLRTAAEGPAAPAERMLARASDLVLTAGEDGEGPWLEAEYDAEVLSAATVEGLLACAAAMGAARGAASSPFHALPLIDGAAREHVLRGFNATLREFPRERCVHDLFDAQVARTPEKIALRAGSTTWTYRELDQRVEALARSLVERGVRRGDVVGVALPREADLVAATLAVLRAGAAFLPLDPDHPPRRLAAIAKDAAVRLVAVATAEDAGAFEGAEVLALDALAADHPVSAGRVRAGAESGDLAYVIYTSGSTGAPKGVMVEHRNVVNFFTGMDEVLGTEPGVWLAVTSSTFDISVLELLWTLCRGFEVVLFSAAREGSTPVPSHRSLSGAASRAGIEFDLFYFGSDGGRAGTPGSARYRLLLDGARFADRAGFSAVWTPERHFDDFGGLFPAPTVAGGALAAVTQRIAIRTGSIVLPLHDEVRVAEELQFLDNLSDGRVGAAFAAGWQPDDFVLAPESYERRHAVTADKIARIRALWRGEPMTRPNGAGAPFEFRTLPRPVQPELPIWLTCGGGRQGFVTAGELGVNVLTHLLGQGLDGLAENVRAYRRARRDAGHAGDGFVTLMLHTFLSAEGALGADETSTRAEVRAALKAYVRGSQRLFGGYARQIGVELEKLEERDRDALAEHSIGRYLDGGGLFGTVEEASETIDRLMALGVDGVACLIDFGLDVDLALAGLDRLDELRSRYAAPRGSAQPSDGDVHPESIPALIRRFGATHLQCTPSMCALLLADDRGAGALAGLAHLVVGGEELRPALVAKIRAVAPSVALTNMYGPTETTIWSTYHRVEGAPSEVPIGRPLANTQVFVLDERMEPLPPGIAGDLWIAGEGVARGYLGREDLTRASFVAAPGALGLAPGARLYRTGDRARFRDDGALLFHGRRDGQVKLRGHRIELGEVESALASLAGIAAAAAAVREDEPGDVRLVAYLVPASQHAVDLSAVRRAVAAVLPPYMLPGEYAVLDALPLTPSGKLARAALPRPGARSGGLPGPAAVGSREARERAAGPSAAAGSVLEQVLAVWRRVLRRDAVGSHENFFDVGGHSLLVAGVVNELRGDGFELGMVDVFQHPTAASLAAHLEARRGGTGGGGAGGGESSSGTAAGASRAAKRREAAEARRRRPS